MEEHQHLKLPLFEGNFDRAKGTGGGGFLLPEGRQKTLFSTQSQSKADDLERSTSKLKNEFPEIDPKLIFEIED